MKKIISSPISYWGSKRRLLKQLIPLFPSQIDTFYDLFCGSLSVSLNVKSSKVIANDIDKNVYNILKLLIENDNLIKDIILFLKYNPINNKEDYEELRKFYNNSEYKSPFILFILQIHSFNNLLRFNSNSQFNAPYGNRTFNGNKKKSLHETIIRIKENNIILYNKSYNQFNDFNPNDFVYLDPPYLITNAEYNKLWDENDELELLKYLDKLNNKGIKFGLSNVIENDNKKNHILLEWAKKYNIINIDIDYNYSMYNKDRNSKNSTKEVYICNYKPKQKKYLF